jgi:hypothetical protein
MATQWGHRMLGAFGVLLVSATFVLGGAGCGIIAGTPEVPVRITTRPSVWQSGLVVQVTNASNKTLLHLLVKISAANGAGRTREIGKIDPGETVELGWIEWNWNAHSGENVTVTANGFRAKSVVRE